MHDCTRRWMGVVVVDVVLFVALDKRTAAAAAAAVAAAAIATAIATRWSWSSCEPKAPHIKDSMGEVRRVVSKVKRSRAEMKL